MKILQKWLRFEWAFQSSSNAWWEHNEEWHFPNIRRFSECVLHCACPCWWQFIFFWCCLMPGTATGESRILSCLVQLLVKSWKQSFYFWLVKRSSMRSLGSSWALWAGKNLYEIITCYKWVTNLSGARISFEYLLVWAKFLRRSTPWSPPAWQLSLPFQSTRMCLSITIINIKLQFSLSLSPSSVTPNAWGLCYLKWSPVWEKQIALVAFSSLYL